MRQAVLRLVTGAAIAAGTVFAGAAPVARGGEAAGARPGAPDFESALGEKVEICRLTADERKFDKTGWATTILDAEKLAKEHDRPVFLFTHDGRISTGRC